MIKLWAILLIAFKVEASPWSPNELKEIKKYFSADQKSFKAREKAIFYSQSFFHYVTILEKESYSQFLKNDLQFIKEHKIVEILEEHDWKDLIIRFQQYKDSPAGPNGN